MWQEILTDEDCDLLITLERERVGRPVSLAEALNALERGARERRGVRVGSTHRNNR